MKNKRIKGTTRIVGLDQGYAALALRDGKVSFTSGSVLPTMTTEWELSKQERADIAAGKNLFLTIVGNQWPPVRLYVGEENG